MPGTVVIGLVGLALSPAAAAIKPADGPPGQEKKAGEAVRAVAPAQASEPGPGGGAAAPGQGGSAGKRHAGGDGRSVRAHASAKHPPPAGAPPESADTGGAAGAASASPPPELVPLPAAVAAAAAGPAPAAAPAATPARRPASGSSPRFSAPARAPAPSAPPPPRLAAPPADVSIRRAARTRPAAGREGPLRERGFVVTRRIRDLVNVIPDWVVFALAALAGIALLLGAGVVLAGMRARRLERQRRGLLEEVGLLEAAVVPDVPHRVGGVWTSVAYRAADGPAAGGDFFDVFPTGDRGAGVVVGDVMGHGGQALGQTTLLRYTLRAFLEADLSPRDALRTADRVLGERLRGDFATVVVALHDRRAGTLTYACAGHPPPVLLGPPQHIPVLHSAAAPVGSGAPAGVRQTTVSFPEGSLACFYTDGLTEARADERLLGSDRLAGLIADLGPAATAGRVLDAVAGATTHMPDDMAVCVLRPAGPSNDVRIRVEELELSPAEVERGAAAAFMRACGVGEFSLERADSLARRTVHKFGGAAGVVVRVRISGFSPGVDILPARGEEPRLAGPLALAGTRV